MRKKVEPVVNMKCLRGALLIALGFSIWGCARIPAAAQNEGRTTANIGDAYGAALLKEFKTKYSVDVALVSGEVENAQKFQIIGPAADGAKAVAGEVKDEMFKRQVAVDVFNPRGENWHIMGQLLNAQALKAKRNYVLTFAARGRVPGIGGQNAVAPFAIKHRPSGEVWVSEHNVMPGTAWQRYFLTFTPKADCAIGDVEAIWVLGQQKQQVEIAGITWLDAAHVSVENLPGRQAVVTDYKGRAPDAAWRKAALQRIEKHRKANLTVTVKDATGKTLPGANVEINMTRHAFGWGTSLVPSWDLKSSPGENPFAPHVRETLRHFNRVTPDIDLKATEWLKADAQRREKNLAGLKELSESGFKLKGHTMVWPGFRTNPQWLSLRDKPEELRDAIRAHILDGGKATTPFTDSWDVVNEPYDDREIIRLLGEDETVKWFKLARSVLPSQVLYVNEAGLTNYNFGRDTPRQDYIFNLLKTLLAKGAPVGGLGDQGHYDMPVEPEQILTVWNRFAQLPVELAVTEFDVNLGDAQLEADFTRDVTIAAFSQPKMTSFTMWGAIDQAHWKGNAPLYTLKDGQMQLKPSGKAWLDLVYKSWWTSVHGATKNGGSYNTRGFLGDYEIKVSHGKRSKTIRATLPKNGRALTVTLN